jgi:hypothetical protein
LDLLIRTSPLPKRFVSAALVLCLFASIGGWIRSYQRCDNVILHLGDYHFHAGMVWGRLWLSATYLPVLLDRSRLVDWYTDPLPETTAGFPEYWWVWSTGKTEGAVEQSQGVWTNWTSFDVYVPHGAIILCIVELWLLNIRFLGPSLKRGAFPIIGKRENGKTCAGKAGEVQ